MEERKETGGEEKEEKQRRKRLGQGKVRHSHHLEQDAARLDLSERSQGGNTDKVDLKKEAHGWIKLLFFLGRTAWIYRFHQNRQNHC